MNAAEFSARLMEWGKAKEREMIAIKDIAAAEVYRSVVHGSELTGAPGQPVDTGELRDSWKMEALSPTITLIATDSPYARAIEHNWRRVTRKHFKTFQAANPSFKRMTKSAQKLIRKTLGGLRFRGRGGSHSVKTTKRAWPRIIRHAAAKMRWGL